MFALIRYRMKEQPPLLRWNGAAFRCVYLPAGRGVLPALAAGWSGSRLRREGVREALFPADYPYVERFARRGVSPVSPCPLYRAAAPALALRALRQLDCEAKSAAVCLSARRVTAELERAADVLSESVRYLVLAVPSAEALARRLLLRRGVAARIASPEERVSAALLLRFDDAPVLCDAPALPLYDPTWTSVFDAAGVPQTLAGVPQTALLTALWRCGCLDRNALTVTHCPQTASENGRV